MAETLKYFLNGEYVASSTEKYVDVFNPSTGEVMAKSPCCTKEEVEEAIGVAKTAFQTWKNVPPMKRAQILYKKIGRAHV